MTNMQDAIRALRSQGCHVEQATPSSWDEHPGWDVELLSGEWKYAATARELVALANQVQS